MPRIEPKTIFDIANVIGNIKTDLTFKKKTITLEESNDNKIKDSSHQIISK